MEVREDTWRYEEIRGDTRRCEETLGDAWRWSINLLLKAHGSIGGLPLGHVRVGRLRSVFCWRVHTRDAAIPSRLLSHSLSRPLQSQPLSPLLCCSALLDTSLSRDFCPLDGCLSRVSFTFSS